MGTFELFRSSANKDYYFRLKNEDGHQLLSSEGYTTKQACSNGIESVRKNAPLDQRYERKDGDGRYSFNLKAANGEIIARSTKSYTMRTDRDAAIESVKCVAPGALVVDLT